MNKYPENLYGDEPTSLEADIVSLNRKKSLRSALTWYSLTTYSTAQVVFSGVPKMVEHLEESHYYMAGGYGALSMMVTAGIIFGSRVTKQSLDMRNQAEVNRVVVEMERANEL